MAALVAIAAMPAPRAVASTIADQRGRAVAIATPARRVVSLVPNVTYTYLTVDGTAQHLAGTRADVPERVRALLLGRAVPQAAQLVGVGGIESVLELDPDAVFEWSYVDELDLLDQTGLPVLALNNEETSFATWPAIVGAVSGKRTRAEHLVTDYGRRLDELRGDLTPIPGAQRIRVIVLGQIEPQIVSATFAHAFAIAGVQSCVSERSAILGIERIYALDPDIVLVFGGSGTPADVYGSPQWQALRAVRARRVYEIPEEWPGFNGIVDEPLFGRWLAELAYPRRLSKGLRADVRATYARTFGYRATDADLDRALRLDANRDSAGYLDRFGR